jgi:hypothetical protein
MDIGAGLAVEFRQGHAGRDCEGSIVLDRMPSKAEAAEIRDILGIPKRIELSEGQLANLRAHAAANAFKPGLSVPPHDRPALPPVHSRREPCPVGEAQALAGQDLRWRPGCAPWLFRQP